MKHTKHTPGEWFAYSGSNNRVSIEMGEFKFSANGSGREIEANARLIAAAPDLLEALERIVNEAVERSLKETETASYLIAQNAIAKARGES